MSGRTYVAVNVIRHGNADGTVTFYNPGEEVVVGEGEMTPELVQDFLRQGTVTVAGWADDPNLSVDLTPNVLSPAMIEAGITENFRGAHGPAPTEEELAHLHPDLASQVPSTDAMNPGTVSGATTSRTPLADGTLPAQAAPKQTAIKPDAEVKTPAE